jgi:hypothetical protein
MKKTKSLIEWAVERTIMAAACALGDKQSTEIRANANRSALAEVMDVPETMLDRDLCGNLSHVKHAMASMPGFNPEKWGAAMRRRAEETVKSSPSMLGPVLVENLLETFLGSLRDEKGQPVENNPDLIFRLIELSATAGFKNHFCSPDDEDPQGRIVVVPDQELLKAETDGIAPVPAAVSDVKIFYEQVGPITLH